MLIASGLALAACGDAATPRSGLDDRPVSVQDADTPLDRLWPGQRMPDRYVRTNGAAFMQVDLLQYDDAVTGRMTLTVDSSSVDDCRAVSVEIEPWFELCLTAMQSGSPLVLEAPANFRRETVRVGDRAMPAGAYASLSAAAVPEPVHATLLNKDTTGYLLRIRASAASEIRNYQPGLDLFHEDRQLALADEVRQRIERLRVTSDTAPRH